MTIPFDLGAPISPGKSAAGVQLGDDLSKILEWAKPHTITPLTHGERYDFGSVVLWGNGEGKVEQIGLYSGYRGKVTNTVGIGSTLGEVAVTIGTVLEDEDDNLIVLGSPGWCIETHQWRQQKNNLPDLAAVIDEIYIFSESKQKIISPKYPKVCPQCQSEMRFDLILKDGRGVNSSDVKGVASEDIAGYGFFCKYCKRGWTGDQLLKMISKGKSSE